MTEVLTERQRSFSILQRKTSVSVFLHFPETSEKKPPCTPDFKMHRETTVYLWTPICSIRPLCLKTCIAVKYEGYDCCAGLREDRTGETCRWSRAGKRGRKKMITFRPLHSGTESGNSILFNEYGLGLTLICFYTILAGLKKKILPKKNSFLTAFYFYLSDCSVSFLTF